MKRALLVTLLAVGCTPTVILGTLSVDASVCPTCDLGSADSALDAGGFDAGGFDAGGFDFDLGDLGDSGSGDGSSAGDGATTGDLAQ